MRESHLIRRLSGAVSLAATLVACALVSPAASATIIFNFSDNGGGTTLVTASGSADLTGGTPADSVHLPFVGWDDMGLVGVNDSSSLVADSNFFSFNSPNVTGVYHYYAATLGGTPLNVEGVALSTVAGLSLDGTGASYPFFTLYFTSALPQTGIVSASGSAVVAFDFANLPYASGQSIDLQGNGDVVFRFGPVATPEPATTALLGIGLLGLGFARRRSA